MNSNFYKYFKVFEDAGAVVEMTIQVVRSLSDSYVPLGVLTGPFMPTVLNPECLTSMQGIFTNNHDASSDIFLAEKATHRWGLCHSLWFKIFHL